MENRNYYQEFLEQLEREGQESEHGDQRHQRSWSQEESQLIDPNDPVHHLPISNRAVPGVALLPPTDHLVPPSQSSLSSLPSLPSNTYYSSSLYGNPLDQTQFNQFNPNTLATHQDSYNSQSEDGFFIPKHQYQPEQQQQQQPGSQGLQGIFYNDSNWFSDLSSPAEHHPPATDLRHSISSSNPSAYASNWNPTASSLTTLNSHIFQEPNQDQVNAVDRSQSFSFGSSDLPSNDHPQGKTATRQASVKVGPSKSNLTRESRESSIQL